MVTLHIAAFHLLDYRDGRGLEPTSNQRLISCAAGADSTSAWVVD